MIGAVGVAVPWCTGFPFTLGAHRQGRRLLRLQVRCRRAHVPGGYGGLAHAYERTYAYMARVAATAMMDCVLLSLIVYLFSSVSRNALPPRRAPIGTRA